VTISEISEILSLTNEPDKLANMALDTLSRVLDIECCWIQVINGMKDNKLLLAAERGFSPEIRREIDAMDVGHAFSKQIIGLGHKIIIPNLYHDGLYGLPSFRDSGFKWLVAAPLMTYRVYGILGTASRNRKLLKKDTADLIKVIAGLIATSLSKTYLSSQSTGEAEPAKLVSREVKRKPVTRVVKPENPADIIAPAVIPAPLDTRQTKPAKSSEGAFPSHIHKMETFRRSHH
jgi:hypothetical protein